MFDGISMYSRIHICIYIHTYAPSELAAPIRWARMYGCIYVYVCVNTCIYHQTSNFSNPSSKLYLRDFQKITCLENKCFFVVVFTNCHNNNMNKSREPNFEIWPWDPSRSLSHVLLNILAQSLRRTALLRSVLSRLKLLLEL